jgi:flagellar biosynthetic protein FlhB
MAKGQDAIALKIREIAEQHNIPIVEDRLLAKTLYHATEVDQLIPAEFYKAVAEIILYLNSKSRPGQRGPGKNEPPPGKPR